MNITDQWQRGPYIHEHPNMRLSAKTSKLEVHHKVELANGENVLVAEPDLRRLANLGDHIRH